MNATMISISEQEFRTYPVFNVGVAPATEKAWFRCGEHLGIVLVDNVDHDWSFVALAKVGDQFRGVDVGASLPTQEAATRALAEALRTVRNDRRGGGRLDAMSGGDGAHEPTRFSRR